ncbi:MAG: hypothetical protein O2931_13120, partial [Planctomycetota bacterium]|nr:hypothetical protein [Planctomycetota bacterium]
PPNVPDSLHGTSTMTWTYDSVGNVAASRGVRSHSENDEYYTTYAHDARHRRTHTIEPEPGTLDHAASQFVTHYDAVGRVEREEYPSAIGSVARTFRYDDLDHILQIIEPGGVSGAAVTSYNYDLRGNLTGRTDALSRQFVNTYDELDQLTYELWPDTGTGSGSQLWHRIYTDWGELERLEQTATVSGSAIRAWDYEYDLLDDRFWNGIPIQTAGGCFIPTNASITTIPMAIRRASLNMWTEGSWSILRNTIAGIARGIRSVLWKRGSVRKRFLCTTVGGN